MAFKLSDFMVALTICISLILIVLLFVGDGVYKYDRTFNESQFGNLSEKFTQITNTTETIKEDAQSYASDQNVFDIIGNYFSQGWRTMLLTFSSIDIFYSMINGMFGDNLNFGPAGQLIINMITTIVLIIFFIGIILAIVLKWQT